MKILVTGGTGFIGSHTCVELLDAGYDVVIVDNLSNSKKEVVSYIEKITGKKVAFYENDVCDKKESIFKYLNLDMSDDVFDRLINKYNLEASNYLVDLLYEAIIREI